MLVPWSDFFKELCLIFGGRCNGASWDGWQSWGLLLKLCLFLLSFFFGVCSNHLVDTNRGIQFLHVETSGRLLHHQRKEAEAKHAVLSTNVTLFWGKTPNSLGFSFLPVCQSSRWQNDFTFPFLFGSAFEAFDKLQVVISMWRLCPQKLVLDSNNLD